MIFSKKKAETKKTPFFDYPAKEKKRILKSAMQESIRMQNELIDKYSVCFAE